MYPLLLAHLPSTSPLLIPFPVSKKFASLFPSIPSLFYSLICLCFGLCDKRNHAMFNFMSVVYSLQHDCLQMRPFFCWHDVILFFTADHYFAVSAALIKKLRLFLFSRISRCISGLLIWGHSVFLMWAVIATNSCLGTALTVCHKVWYAVFLWSFYSGNFEVYSLVFFCDSLVIHKYILQSPCIFVVSTVSFAVNL